MVLSAVGVSRRMMVSEAPASWCQLRGPSEPGGSTAATIPTRWPVPRPDAGRPSAATGGSRGLAIRCSCRMDLLCRPAELAAVAQHAMEDDRELAGHGDGGLL